MWCAAGALLILLGVWGYNMFMKSMYPIKYEALVKKYSSEYEVDESLVYAVIYTESRFKPEAVSSVGAKGLMQITPETFQWLQTKHPSKEALPEDALFDPETNIKYGVYFLSLLKAEFNENRLILSAYHAGRGSVNRWLGDPEMSSDGKSLDKIPFKDTNSYVGKVEKTESIYKNLYKFKEND
jgi:soluble lytic murein transglycosylase